MRRPGRMSRAIIGVGGAVPYQGREIGIRQLSIEEDSCREVSDVAHLRTYRADRLGMPLTEFVTAPAFRNPREVAEGGRAIQALERVTPVRRGIGAARQDVNVSITGGDRVEIKGPGTDLSFSIAGLPAVKCDGGRNIPDGEVYTAPVKDSVNGVIQYNTKTRQGGVVLGGKIAPIFFNTIRGCGAIPVRCSTGNLQEGQEVAVDLAEGEVLDLRPEGARDVGARSGRAARRYLS